MNFSIKNRKKIILFTCALSLIHSSCLPIEREILGWCVTAFGAVIVATGIYKICQKEEPAQPINVTSSHNSGIVINANPTSNTAKGSAVAAIGLYIANKGLGILNSK